MRFQAEMAVGAQIVAFLDRLGGSLFLTLTLALDRLCSYLESC